MQVVAPIGLDSAKSVFRVDGVDAQGKVVTRGCWGVARFCPFSKKLPSDLVGIEPGATSHQLIARAAGRSARTVRLMPPAYEPTGDASHAAACGHCASPRGRHAPAGAGHPDRL